MTRVWQEKARTLCIRTFEICEGRSEGYNISFLDELLPITVLDEKHIRYQNFQVAYLLHAFVGFNLYYFENWNVFILFNSRYHWMFFFLVCFNFYYDIHVFSCIIFWLQFVHIMLRDSIFFQLHFFFIKPCLLWYFDRFILVGLSFDNYIWKG